MVDVIWRMPKKVVSRLLIGFVVSPSRTLAHVRDLSITDYTIQFSHPTSHLVLSFQSFCPAKLNPSVHIVISIMEWLADI